MRAFDQITFKILITFFCFSFINFLAITRILIRNCVSQYNFFLQFNTTEQLIKISNLEHVKCFSNRNNATSEIIKISTTLTRTLETPSLFFYPPTTPFPTDHTVLYTLSYYTKLISRKAPPTNI